MNDNIKFAAILSFMGQTRDRFQTWGPLYTLEEKVQRVAQLANAMPGLVTAAQGNGITFWTHPYGDTVQ